MTSWKEIREQMDRTEAQQDDAIDRVLRLRAAQEKQSSGHDRINH